MTRSQAFFAGFRATIPLLVGAIPFGIIFGTLAGPSGLSVGGALGFSAIVFAGSSQFIALGLLSGSAGIAIVIFTTFVVNLRHLLYSAALVDRVKHLPQRWRIPMAFWLTDETFAAVADFYRKIEKEPDKAKSIGHWFYLGSALPMYTNWQLCTIVGLILGDTVPGIDQWGLEFAMSATFIGMVAPYLTGVFDPKGSKGRHRALAMWVCVSTSGLLAMLTNDMPHRLGIIVAATIGILAGYLVLSLYKREEAVS